MTLLEWNVLPWLVRKQCTNPGLELGPFIISHQSDCWVKGSPLWYMFYHMTCMSSVHNESWSVWEQMSPSQSVFLKCANSNSGFQLEIIWKQISGPKSGKLDCICEVEASQTLYSTLLIYTLGWIMTLLEWNVLPWLVRKQCTNPGLELGPFIISHQSDCWVKGSPLWYMFYHMTCMSSVHNESWSVWEQMSPSQSVFLKCANSNSGFQLEIIWKQISGPDQKTFKVFKEKVFFIHHLSI